MKKCNRHVPYALIGAAGSLASMGWVSRCGGNCAACFGCAGVGLVIVLILLGRWIRNGKEGASGMD